MAQEEVLGLTFWKPVLLKSVQPASFFFFRIWFLIFAFSYSLLKVLTMMGMGREMMRTPTMAQQEPTIFPGDRRMEERDLKIGGAKLNSHQTMFWG